MKLYHFIAFVIIPIFVSCNNTDSNTISAVTETVVEENSVHPPISLTYEVIKVYPHDTTSYTQGLEWNGEHLIESTGEYGKSKLQLLFKGVHPISNKVQLKDEFFGEGTTLFNGKIYQLTWKEHKVFVYDAISLHKINEFYWPYEGWGLTHNDSSLIVSSGGSNIYFVNPDNFSILKTVGVFNQYGYVSDINELEWVDGKLYANLYRYNEKTVIVIDPNSGKVTHTIDFSNLLAQAGVRYNPQDIDAGYVLNGIAYKKESSSFFITGKCWPVMIEVKIKYN